MIKILIVNTPWYRSSKSIQKEIDEFLNPSATVIKYVVGVACKRTKLYVSYQDVQVPTVDKDDSTGEGGDVMTMFTTTIGEA
jgi:hypothetical protein|tara:strand:+ start:1609 stop:1854 length:246 start_codon:yes stop_codon:yes gene_type:complete